MQKNNDNSYNDYPDYDLTCYDPKSVDAIIGLLEYASEMDQFSPEIRTMCLEWCHDAANAAVQGNFETFLTKLSSETTINRCIVKAFYSKQIYNAWWIEACSRAEDSLKPSQ